MILEFSESDLQQSVVLPPDWYRVDIEEAEDKISSKGDSTNTWLKGKILFNSNTGQTEYEKGVDLNGNPIIQKIAGLPTPFPWLFNSKGAFAAVGFAQALGMEVKPGSKLNLLAAKGKQVDMFIENVVYEGVLKNSVSGKYRAPREVNPAA